MDATVESIIASLTNPIDRLAIIDRQIKELTEQSKALKEEISNSYGEGKHVGEKYAVSVSLYQSKTVDTKGLIAALQIPADTVAQYTKHNAVIRVSVVAA